MGNEVYIYQTCLVCFYALCASISGGIFVSCIRHKFYGTIWAGISTVVYLAMTIYMAVSFWSS